MVRQILSRLRRGRGATMVEYSIMVAFFAVFLITAVVAMRDAIDDGFQSVCTALSEGAPDLGIDCSN